MYVCVWGGGVTKRMQLSYNINHLYMYVCTYVCMYVCICKFTGAPARV